MTKAHCDWVSYQCTLYLTEEANHLHFDLMVVDHADQHELNGFADVSPAAVSIGSSKIQICMDKKYENLTLIKAK